MRMYTFTLAGREILRLWNGCPAARSPLQKWLQPTNKKSQICETRSQISWKWRKNLGRKIVILARQGWICWVFFLGGGLFFPKFLSKFGFSSSPHGLNNQKKRLSELPKTRLNDRQQIYIPSHKTLIQLLDFYLVTRPSELSVTTGCDCTYRW